MITFQKLERMRLARDGNITIGWIEYDAGLEAWVLTPPMGKVYTASELEQIVAELQTLERAV